MIIHYSRRFTGTSNKIALQSNIVRKRERDVAPSDIGVSTAKKKREINAIEIVTQPPPVPFNCHELARHWSSRAIFPVEPSHLYGRIQRSGDKGKVQRSLGVNWSETTSRQRRQVDEEWRWGGEGSPLVWATRFCEHFHRPLSNFFPPPNRSLISLISRAAITSISSPRKTDRGVDNLTFAPRLNSCIRRRFLLTLPSM